MGPRHSFWGVLGPAEAPRFDREKAALAGFPAGAAAKTAPSAVASLIGILGEANRVAARCQIVFGRLREECDLSGIEALTLIAIVHATAPPTVPQVGRSLGHPRQVIQRAVRVLEERGLVETQPNPGHKRASLLVATEAGRTMGRRIDAGTEEIVREIGQGMDPDMLAATHVGLLALRDRIDQRSADEIE